MRYPAKITKSYLLKLSIPIFFSNLAIPLVGLIDTVLMGHMENARFLVATSIATSVISMIFWSFGFLRMGTTGLVAQALGRGDYRDLVLTVVRNLCLAALFGFIILFLQYPILLIIKYFFNSSNETQYLISKYISVRLFSAPTELAAYVLIGLYIGIQKTKISSFIIIIYSFLNIILSIYFVNYLNLNIYGVALGTVISSYIVFSFSLLFTYYYIQKKFNVIPRFKKIFVRKKIIKLFNINFDIFIRTVLITFAFLWFTYQSSKISEDYLAINSILLQFVVLASFFLDSYAYSTEGIVGFSLGRKVKKSFIFAVRNAFELSFITGLIISIIYLIFFRHIINFITDLEYLKYLSYGYIVWVFLIPPIGSFCYQFDGIFIGTSKTSEMRNSMIVSVAVYITASIYLVEFFNNHGLWLSLVIFMIVRSLTLRFYFSNILNKF